MNLRMILIPIIILLTLSAIQAQMMQKAVTSYWVEYPFPHPDSDGKNEKNISRSQLFDGWPCWSPDGTKILFASDREEKFRFQLYEYNISSEELLRITDDQFSYVQPVYSAGGKVIIAQIKL